MFVCPDGTAKLMDFGVAHVFADDSQTQTGMVVGSPAYMSPEQINGRLLDGRSDVFSLAVTLAEAVTGRKPFEGPNIPAVMNQILHRPPQLAGIASRPLRRAVEHALAKSPPARTPSPAAFAEALRRIEPSPSLAGSPQATLVMPLPPALMPRPARRAPWAGWGGGIAVLGLVALAALPFLLPHRPAAPPGPLPTSRTATHLPAGRLYHTSSEWRRATHTSKRRVRHRSGAVSPAPPPCARARPGRGELFAPARRHLPRRTSRASCAVSPRRSR